MTKRINLGLIGFGTVGSGVYELLKRNSELVKERSGIDLRVKVICDLRVEEIKRGIRGVDITDSWKSVVDDDSIDSVIELIGGIEPAKSIILNSLSSGKNVITANKKLLAEEGDEIFQLANRVSAKLGFEAAVGGGIPCILSLKSGLIANRIKTVMGILNGTTNYILTKMEDENISFEAALKDAQERGFAEADPSFDIEGFDAAHKISILSMLAFNKRIDYNSISIEGITGINELDIRYAREMGYIIKLLGISKHINDGIDIRVHPTMLPLKHPLASVRNELNAVMFDSDMTGSVILYGKGAGGHPTASAVVSDVVHIAQKKKVEERPIVISGDAKYILPDKRISRYYMRLHTEDRAGILSKISGVLGKNDISIASVIQKEINEPYVPLVIMTHEAVEDGVIQSVKEINDFDFIDGKITLIRVEDSVAV
jgi:homoserine dehydrogenase